MTKRRMFAIAGGLLLLAIVVGAASVPESSQRYRVQVLFHTNGQLAIRYSETSGQTWALLGEEWLKVPEPDQLEPGHYEFEMALSPDKSKWAVFRINVRNGRTWGLYLKEPTKVAWREIKEAQ